MDKTEKEKDNNFLMILSVLVLFAAIIMVAGISYAYYTKKIEGGDNTRVIIKSADILLKYDEGNALQVYDIEPGWADNFTFSIENYSTDIDAKYKISLEIIDPFTDVIEESFVYTLVGVSNKANSSNNSVINVSQTAMPIKTTELGITSISAGTIHNYTLNIKFIDNGKNQNYLQNKTFIGKIKVESVYE